MLESPQQEDPCLQCGGNGQSCYRVKNSFSVRDLPTGTLNMLFLTWQHTVRCVQSSHLSHQQISPSPRYHKTLKSNVRDADFFLVWLCSILYVWKELCLIFFSGYNQMFIIPVGATTISIRETVATRNYLGEFVFHVLENKLVEHQKKSFNSLHIIQQYVWLYSVHTMTVTSMRGQLSRTCVVSTTSMATG